MIEYRCALCFFPILEAFLIKIKSIQNLKIKLQIFNTKLSVAVTLLWSNTKNLN